MDYRTFWSERVDRSPLLAQYLKRIAYHWASGRAVPLRMELGPISSDHHVFLELRDLFNGYVYQENGKISVDIPLAFRDEEALAPLAEVLGIQRQHIVTAAMAIIERMELLYPELKRVHAWLRGSAEIKALLEQNPVAYESLLKLTILISSDIHESRKSVTLSELSHKYCHNSMVLRQPVARIFLGGVLNAMLGWEDTPENREIALMQHQIVTAPTTTCVTLFGPLELRLVNGSKDDWIAQRFYKGESVTLNSHALSRIDRVHLPSTYSNVVTSEKTECFDALCTEKLPALIVLTDGFPNAAVLRLLQLLGAAGLFGFHWGNTDPNGLRIAALIQQIIPSRLWRSDLKTVGKYRQDLVQFDAVRVARAAQIYDRPEFPYRRELAFAIENGWLDQEYLLGHEDYQALRGQLNARG
jgi:hypothetical protein